MKNTERIKPWFSALCLVPWLAIGGVYAEACIVRVLLSRRPRPRLDDPKQLATAPHHLAFQLVLLFLVFVIPVVVVSAISNWRKLLSDWRYSAQLGVFAIGLLAIWMSSHCASRTRVVSVFGLRVCRRSSHAI